MGIMAIGQIIVLSALVTQALSAPSGCIEACNFLETTVHQTSSGYQDHASLVQGGTHLNDHDYARPGNWTEHNQYNTDGGHGKVHEERGQYEEGAKRVRYYKKNFTASYGMDNVNGVDTAELNKLSDHRYDSIHAPNSQHIDSQSAYGLGQTVKETGYNRLHSQQTQSMSTRIDSKSERLEDFGEYDRHSQMNQHVPSINTQTIDTQHHVETPDNWRRVDSYRTDGGHGHVFEEEGQYVTGPKKVRYYKKNYTSSYSAGVPQGNIGSTTLDELHSKLQRNLQKDLDSFKRDFHQVSSTGHTAATAHVGSTVGLTQEAVGFHDLQTAESDSYRQNSGYQSVPSTGSMHHYTDQQQRETLTDVRHQLPYTYPTAGADTYGTKKIHQSYETHSSRVLPVSQSSHLSSGYVQIPRDNYQTSYHNAHSRHLDETQRAEVLGAHQTSVLQNQLLTDSERVYNPHSSHITYPNRHGETTHYEEHWRSSSHTGGSVVPERTIVDHSGNHGVAHSERAHYDQNAYSEHRGQHHTTQGYESRTSGSSYNPAYRASSGQLVTGSLDLGHASHGADCTEETHQQYQQHETRYHRKYKRDDHHGNVQQHQTTDNDNFTQQNQEFDQETQQLEDMTQQNEQFTQQTQSDDFTQQTSGKLEFGQQTVDNHDLDHLMQQNEQFTQQTEGQLEFGQQTVDSQHSDNLMQQNEQLTQQTEGKLEFGQQTVDSQHLDDLTQPNEQFIQQTEGQLEFGQQIVNHPRSEDLTQQTQETDLSQQLNDKLEFDQQPFDSEHLDDLTQHSEQFTQQTEGQFEFGQQTVNHPRSEALTQQTQETNLSQQLNDKVEFGQQTVDSEPLDDLTQQSKQFMQQTQGSDDFSQQTNGKFEFGQQTDNTQQMEKFVQRTARSDDPTQQTQLGNEHLDNLTQQSEQISQQTEGQLEFGQQIISNQHLEHSPQKNEQFAQQTVGSDDFTQQSVGNLEFGQQMQSINKPTKPKSQRLEEFNEQSEDFTQQAGEFNEFTQQTMGHLEFGQLRQPHRSDKPKVDNHHLEDFTQQNEDFTQQVGGFNDFSQQTTGHLEYGQQREQQNPSWPRHDSQRLEHYSQRNEWDTNNFSQQSGQYPSYNNNFDQDFTQQVDQDRSAIGVKPAPKPKPRPRYQKQDLIPSHADRTDTTVDNTFKPVEVNPEADIDNVRGRIIESGSRATYPGSNQHTSKVIFTQGSSAFDNQRQNIDSLHGVHNSNDATVGLQWHYTYHPSDLTNIEGSHDNYYPRHNVGSTSQQTENLQQQSKPFDFNFNQQETQDKDTLEDRRQISQLSGHDKYDQRSGSFQQTETSRFDNLFNQESDQTARVIPLQRNENFQLTSEQEKRSTPTAGEIRDEMEPRILQAYGGGPYDASHNDEFYNRIRPNPSATLPPLDGDDPWDIREKPKNVIYPAWSTVRNTAEIATTTEAVEITTQTIQTTTQPSFWSRVGHKITSTYDKAKEKAKEIFG